MTEGQRDLEFEPVLEWEQRLREPPKWFQRFREYCDLGPGRTLTAVFNNFLEGGSEPSRQVPGLWKRMAKRWHWPERAQALDAWKRQQRANELEEVRRARLDQLLALDRDVRYPRIVALHKKIDEIIAGGGLAKTVKVEGNVTMSLDRPHLHSLSLPPSSSPSADAFEKKFEWVVDPEVPPPSPHAPRDEGPEES